MCVFVEKSKKTISKNSRTGYLLIVFIIAYVKLKQRV